MKFQTDVGVFAAVEDVIFVFYQHSVFFKGNVWAAAGDDGHVVFITEMVLLCGGDGEVLACAHLRQDECEGQPIAAGHVDDFVALRQANDGAVFYRHCKFILVAPAVETMCDVDGLGHLGEKVEVTSPV